MAKRQTIEMQGPGGRCVIPVSEKPRYESRGYTVLTNSNSNEQESDLSTLSVAQLRKLAGDRGVEIPSGAKKTDLIELLSAPEPEDPEEPGTEEPETEG